MDESAQVPLWKGYLIDPDQMFSGGLGKRLEDLLEVDVGVLLAKAGVGKTIAMSAEHKRLTAEGKQSRFVNLATVTTAAELLCTLNDALEPVRRSDAEQLWLFLDSRDECTVGTSALTHTLFKVLRDVPPEKLKLRIATRPEFWTDGFREMFRSLVDTLGEVEELQLLPLRYTDVLTLVEDWYAGDRGAILDLIERKNLQELASIPITLRLLCEAAPSHPTDPKLTRTRLYKHGLRRLLDANRARHENDPRCTPKLSAKQRWDLAMAIAALRHLTGFGSEAQPHSLTEALGMMNEEVGATLQDDAAQKLLELGQSAVFAFLDETRAMFAHRSFVEFFAACYLDSKSDRTEQFARILLVEADGARHCPAQLRQTAAWLASMNPAFASMMLEHDPASLVFADKASLPEEVRRQLVPRLIVSMEAEGSHERFRTMRGHLNELGYPGIEDDLNPVIQDGQRPALVRDLASDIAAQSGVTACIPTLVEGVLDASEPERVRSDFAWSLRLLLQGEAFSTNNEHKWRLRTVLDDPALQGEHLDIYGCVLHALWPSSLSAQELFDYLDKPHPDSYWGAYASFAHNFDPTLLVEDDLLIALRWVDQHEGRLAAQDNPGFHYREMKTEALCDKLIFAAAKRLPDTTVESTLGSILTRRGSKCVDLFGRRPLRRSDGPAPTPLEDWLDERAENTLHLVTLLGDSSPAECDGPVWIWHLFQQIGQARLQGILGHLIQLSLTASGATQAFFVALTNAIVSRVDFAALLPEDRELVIAATRVQERPSNLFPFLDAVVLDSQIARRAREDVAQALAWEAEDRLQSQPKEKRTTREYIEAWLGVTDRESEAWFAVLQALLTTGSLDDEFHHMSMAAISPALESTTFKEADEELRKSIVSCACRYLHCAPAVPGCSVSGLWARVMAREALRLVADSSATMLDSLGKQWDIWLDMLIGDDSIDADHTDRAWVSIAQRARGGRIVEIVRRRLGTRLKAHPKIFGLAAVPEESRRSLVPSVLDRVRAEYPMGQEAMEEALEFAVRYDQQACSEVVTHVLTRFAAGGNEWDELLEIVVQIVLSQGQDWEPTQIACIDHVSTNREWSESFFHRLNASLEWNDWSQTANWSEAVLAALARWCSLQSDFDKPNSTADSVSRRIWGQLVRELGSRSSVVALQALQILKNGDSSDWWIDEQIRRHRENRFEARQFEPAEIQRLLSDPAARVVTTHDELMHLVRESLERLQLRLRDQPGPLNRMLWDFREDGTSPKDEGTFCDFVRDHLQQDLVKKPVVVNREVQILRPKLQPAEPDEPQGKRLDILVQAISAGTTLQVIVESKLDTNRGLLTDCGEQLINRYLHGVERPAGMYLVAWTGQKRKQWPNPQHLADTLQASARAECSSGLLLDVFVLDISIECP